MTKKIQLPPLLLFLRMISRVINVIQAENFFLLILLLFLVFVYIKARFFTPTMNEFELQLLIFNFFNFDIQEKRERGRTSERKVNAKKAPQLKAYQSFN